MFIARDLTPLSHDCLILGEQRDPRLRLVKAVRECCISTEHEQTHEMNLERVQRKRGVSFKEKYSWGGWKGKHRGGVEMPASDAENKSASWKKLNRNAYKKKEVKLEKVILKERKGNSQFPGLCLVHLFGLVFTRFSACHMATGCSHPMGLQKGTSSFLISPWHSPPPKNFSSKVPSGCTLSLSLDFEKFQYSTSDRDQEGHSLGSRIPSYKTCWRIG